MTQVTIRRVEEEWVIKAKAEAQELGVSMNQVLLDALSRGLGVDGKPRLNGLEKLAGTMPPDPAFERFLNEDLMEIHPEDWK